MSTSRISLRFLLTGSTMTGSSRFLTPLYLKEIAFRASTQTITARRLFVDLLFELRNGSLLHSRCLLDSGAPLCVVPFSVHNGQGLSWHSLPGPWPAGFRTWLGVRCTLGSVNVWLSRPGLPQFHGPIPLIAKFADVDPPNVKPPISVLVGLNFLADIKAHVNFQFHTPPHGGSIVLP